MNTFFARAVVALGLVSVCLLALPGSALASTKPSTKHSHAVAKKDVTPKKSKHHHAHQWSIKKSVATTTTKPSVAAKTAPAAPTAPDASEAPAKAP